MATWATVVGEEIMGQIDGPKTLRTINVNPQGLRVEWRGGDGELIREAAFTWGQLCELSRWYTPTPAK